MLQGRAIETAKEGSHSKATIPVGSCIWLSFDFALSKLHAVLKFIDTRPCFLKVTIKHSMAPHFGWFA